MPETVVTILINGLLLGGVYALIALGLNIQYGVGRVFNIAHGEFIMLGAFITYVLFTNISGISPPVALAIVSPFLFLLGFVIYRTLFTTLRKRSPSPAAFEGSSLLVAFGLIFVIQNIAILIWSGRTRLLQWFNVPVRLPGFEGYVVFRANQLVAFGIAIAIGVAFYIFVNRSRLGKAIRAAAQDPGDR